MAISLEKLVQYTETEFDQKSEPIEKTSMYSETYKTISHVGSPVRESRTSGTTGGVPREGYVYQPKPFVRFCEGLASQGASLLDT